MYKRIFRLMSKKYHSPSTKLGFTIIEVVVVVTVIGILTTMMVYLYSGIQAKVIDGSVESDVERMATLQVGYKYSHGVSGKEYYSGTGSDEELNFTAKTGNVIDVVISDTDFCVRGYNIKGTKNTIYNPYIEESSANFCESISASPQAISDSLGTPFWAMVAAGESHTCAVDTRGKVFCWGLNGNGQLGDESYVSKNEPTAVSDLGVLAGLTIKSISSYRDSTCVIGSNDQAYCWGRGTSGELGNGSSFDSNVPVSVYNADPLTLSGKTIEQISVGYAHACVIASNNKSYCWGSNTSGQFGIGDNTVVTGSNVPVSITLNGGALNGKSINKIAAGKNHTCAISTEDLTYCWGYNSYGEVGSGNTDSPQLSPVYVNGTGYIDGMAVKSITASGDHNCVIATDNKSYCWGYNSTGQLGDNTNVLKTSSVPVNTDGVLKSKLIKTIDNNYKNTCAVDTNNKMYCWGSNYYGQLGIGTTDPSYSYTPVSVVSSPAFDGTYVKDIGVGEGHICAVTSTGKIYCWGKNVNGQLGIGNNDTPQSLPSLVDSPPAV